MFDSRAVEKKLTAVNSAGLTERENGGNSAKRKRESPC